MSVAASARRILPIAEHALILWAARRIGRPVKWIATRSETFLSDHQARDHVATATLALDAEGKFLALRVDSIANLGAYMAGGAGGVQTNQYAHLQGTVYKFRRSRCGSERVLTNTTPIGVTRGPGFAEAVNIMERLIDAAAGQCGFDRSDLRRRNFVPTALPMTNAFDFSVDSGDFRAAFDRAVAERRLSPVSRSGAPRQRGEAASGAASAWPATSRPPAACRTENVDIRFETDGTVSLITGTQTIGQGHETTMPQILADRLGLPNALIRLRQGDTDLIPMGGGHGSSRATYMGGTAIWRASDIIIAKGKAHRRTRAGGGRSRHRLRRRASSASPAPTGRSLCWKSRPGRATATTRSTPITAWTREAMTFPNGTHVVEVEVDPDTGAVTLERLTAVDDYGVHREPDGRRRPGARRHRAGRRPGAARARGV